MCRGIDDLGDRYYGTETAKLMGGGIIERRKSDSHCPLPWRNVAGPYCMLEMCEAAAVYLLLPMPLPYNIVQGKLGWGNARN